MAQQHVSAWVPEPLATDTFAGRLRLLRLQLGDPSIEEMARRIGVPANNYRRWEAGRDARNLAEVARKIHQATGVDMGWLVFGSAPPAPPASRGTDHQVVWPIAIAPVWQVDADLELAA